MWKVLLKWVLLAVENDQRYHNIGKQGILIFLSVSFIHIHHYELAELEKAMFFVSLQELCRILMAFCSQQVWGWLSSAEDPAGTQTQCIVGQDCFVYCSDPSWRLWMSGTDPDWAQGMHTMFHHSAHLFPAHPTLSIKQLFLTFCIPQLNFPDRELVE